MKLSRRFTQSPKPAKRENYYRGWMGRLDVNYYSGWMGRLDVNYLRGWMGRLGVNYLKRSGEVIAGFNVILILPFGHSLPLSVNNICALHLTTYSECFRIYTPRHPDTRPSLPCPAVPLTF